MAATTLTGSAEDFSESILAGTNANVDAGSGYIALAGGTGADSHEIIAHAPSSSRICCNFQTWLILQRKCRVDVYQRLPRLKRVTIITS